MGGAVESYTLLPDFTDANVINTSSVQKLNFTEHGKISNL
jgi:hypothetical protein